MKKKILRFPMSQSYYKLEQPKLLPGTRPIIQIAGTPILQLPQIVT